MLLVSVQRRNHLILNSGDIVLRDLTLLLAFTPTGAALSFDRYRRLGRDGLYTAGMVAPWGLRLVQLQVMVVYIFAFWSKSGNEWREGIAVSTALRLHDLQRIGELDVLVENIWVVAVLTWGTMVVELMLGTLLWYKPLRPMLIVLGVLLHLSIDGLLLVGFFGLTMIGGLMTFLDGDTIEQSVRAKRQRQSTDGSVDAAPDRRRRQRPNPSVRPGEARTRPRRHHHRHRAPTPGRRGARRSGRRWTIRARSRASNESRRSGRSGRRSAPGPPRGYRVRRRER